MNLTARTGSPCTLGKEALATNVLCFSNSYNIGMVHTLKNESTFVGTEIYLIIDGAILSTHSKEYLVGVLVVFLSQQIEGFEELIARLVEVEHAQRSSIFPEQHL